MELEASPIWNEIQAVANDGPKPVAYYWRGEIHTLEDTETLLKIVSIDNICNYESKVGDELVVETVVPFGLYVKVIYPNRSKLEITLFKDPLGELGNGEKLDEFRETERFKAVPILEGLPVFEATDIDSVDRFTLDLQAPIKISFQLLNRSLEQLRIITVGGIFRKTTNEDVIKGILSKESLKIKINGKVSIDSVDMISADNSSIREHTVIPQGRVKLLELPTYIQEKCNGVYNYSLGTYLQRRNWYVYPLYNTKRFNEANKTAVLIKVPKNRFTGIERTYRIDGETIFILGTSNSSFVDDANTSFMNNGNGVRLADANQFMNGVVSTKDNKAVSNRQNLNHEIIFGEKEDGVNSMYNSSDSISSNTFIERSKISARDGAIVTFNWENSNPGFLIPGMMVKIIYMDNDIMQELTGVLLHKHSFTQLNGKGISVNSHITTCQLNIFVNKVKK